MFFSCAPTVAFAETNVAKINGNGFATIQAAVDAVVDGAGMIDSRGNEIITINGGNFRLYNIGSASNGSLWLLNTSDKNTKNIIVNGGTLMRI